MKDWQNIPFAHLNFLSASKGIIGFKLVSFCWVDSLVHSKAWLCTAACIQTFLHLLQKIGMGTTSFILILILVYFFGLVLDLKGWYTCPCPNSNPSSLSHHLHLSHGQNISLQILCWQQEEAIQPLEMHANLTSIMLKSITLQFPFIIIFLYHRCICQIVALKNIDQP